MTGNKRILIVAYPAGQGHINPALQFAKRVLRMGVKVSFSTSMSVIRCIQKQTTYDNLTFAPIPENDQNPNPSMAQCFFDFATNGAPALSEIITNAATTRKPSDHMVYTTVVPWAPGVANKHCLKFTLLWCQSATTLDLYYYYFNNYQYLISENNDKPNFPINLPGLPPLTMNDLPTFFLSSRPQEHEFAIPLFKDHIDALKGSPRILVSSFNELEVEPIKAIKNLELLPVGPLIPSAFLDGRDPLDKSFGGDLFDKSQEDYIKWLNTKVKSSVVYVSFGSMSTLSADQAEEIATALLQCCRPFLWVIKNELAVKLYKIEELKKQGMIVGWCSQVEVLSHEAIGCFVTHCGWNSTMEALAAGVPTVAFPQWSDQGTNAKMTEDVRKKGVRVTRIEEVGVVEGKEIERCVEIVMGDEHMKRHAEKCKDLARQVVQNDGSSTINLHAFLDDV